MGGSCAGYSTGDGVDSGFGWGSGDGAPRERAGSGFSPKVCRSGWPSSAANPCAAWKIPKDESARM